MRSPLAHRIEADRERLVELARRIVHSRHAAEDVVHDVYVRVHAHAGPIDSPEAWLTSTVRHAAIDRARRSARERRLASAAESPAIGRSAEAEVLAADDVELALEALLQRVDSPTAALWLLREVFGLDHATLAEALGVSEAASRQAARRARRIVETPRPRRRWHDGPDDDFAAVCRHALATGEAGALLAFVRSRTVACAWTQPAVASGSSRAGALRQQLVYVDGRCVLALCCGDAVLCVVPLGPSEELREPA